MQKRFQQLADVALDTLGLSKIDDPVLVGYLSKLDSIEVSFREVEKASNEVYTFFETVQSSTIHVKTAAKECLNTFETSESIRETVERFSTLYIACSTKLEKEIKMRIGENIFAKIEVRREVIATIRKHIEECSQSISQYTSAKRNLESLKADTEALVATDPQTVQNYEQECDHLQEIVKNHQTQLASDMSTYLTNTYQFINECYAYLASLTSFLLASMNSSLESQPQTTSLQPPTNIPKDSITIHLSAGNSTIHYVDLKKGDKIWWKAEVNGGDVGYGVLFKEKQIEEVVKKEVGPEVSNESFEQTSEKPSEQPNEMPSEQSNEKPSEQSNEKPSEQPSEKPSEQPSEKPSEQPSEQSNEKPTQQPTQRSKNVIKTIIPIHRVDPVKEDIRGCYDCSEDGCIEFGFDNSFSYFRSKAITLSIAVASTSV